MALPFMLFIVASPCFLRPTGQPLLLYAISGSLLYAFRRSVLFVAPNLSNEIYVVTAKRISSGPIQQIKPIELMERISLSFPTSYSENVNISRTFPNLPT